MSVMRLAALGAVALTLVTSAPLLRGEGQAARPVVIAELFTSEGCSSCPPADALLAEVTSRQPLDGVEIVALEEHVDYWDDQGWRDPFSSQAFTRRQTDYDERVFHTDNIFTPQLVVDGASQCVGSDGPTVRRALVAAAARPAAVVRVTRAATDVDRAKLSIEIEFPEAFARHGAADVMIALTEGGLATDVRRGENRGRTLAHSAVVRSLAAVATVNSRERSMSYTADVPISPSWHRANLRGVVFVQERDSKRVLGSATVALE